MSAISWQALLILLALVAVCVFAYAPLRHAEFVTFDDPAYVSENPNVARGLTWQGVLWAFTTGYSANWHPLTWLSHMLDVQLFGMSAGPHHLTNLFLHIANTVLLFWLLHSITGALGRSAFVAGLFAVHPLHVQSVAWVAERKDVLSTFFWILTLWFYVAYVRRPRWGRYLWMLCFFALGLMAKPMVVSLPFVLLLLDLWPLGRISTGAGAGPERKTGSQADINQPAGTASRPAAWTYLVLEKIPLFALAAASSIVTFLVQQSGGAVSELQGIPLSLRVENALVSYAAYIGKMLWPARLAVLYPLPPSLPFLWVAGAALLLISISLAVALSARRRPYLVVGWLWYLGTLVPVIGLVQVGLQGMADRYTYVPLIGLFIVVAWGMPDLLARFPYGRRALPVAAALVLLSCAIGARAQVAYWQDSVVLWGHEVEVALDVDKVHAHNALGTILREQGRMSEAMANFTEAIRLDPNSPEAHYGLGLILAGQGRMDEAINSFSVAVRLKPDFAAAQINLGRALASKGRTSEAINHFSAAVRLEPGSADVQRDLGLSLVRLGRIEEAIAAFTAAVQLRPEFAEAHSDLGFALARQGDVDKAILHLTEALRLKPDIAEAHNNLGSALVRAGRAGEALPHFVEAVRLKPDFELAHQNLGIALAGAGRIDEAIREFKEVLRINPGNATIASALDALTRRGRDSGKQR